MNPAATQNPERRSAMLSYLALFTSLSTLLCCALPSLLVLFGLGASVGSVLTFMPWMVTLSHHKRWVFVISGALIAFSFLQMYVIAPRLLARGEACPPDDKTCSQATKLSKRLLWMAAVIYSIGLFTAYFLGPILSWMDGAT